MTIECVASAYASIINDLFENFKEKKINGNKKNYSEKIRDFWNVMKENFVDFVFTDNVWNVFIPYENRK